MQPHLKAKGCVQQRVPACLTVLRPLFLLLLQETIYLPTATRLTAAPGASDSTHGLQLPPAAAPRPPTGRSSTRRLPLAAPADSFDSGARGGTWQQGGQQQQHQGVAVAAAVADALMFAGQDAAAAAAAACSDVLAAAVGGVLPSPAVELQQAPLMQTQGLQTGLMQQQPATAVSGGQAAAAIQPLQQRHALKPIASVEGHKSCNCKTSKCIKP